MRHNVKKIRLGRDHDHGKAILRNLVTSLVMHEKLRTTRRRARALTSEIAHAIRMAKRSSSINAIRASRQFVTTETASKKLLGEIKERFMESGSGFTRMTPLGFRGGDDAEMVLIEFVGGKEKSTEETTKGAKDKKTSAKGKKTIKV